MAGRPPARLLNTIRTRPDNVLLSGLVRFGWRGILITRAALMLIDEIMCPSSVRAGVELTLVGFFGKRASEAKGREGSGKGPTAG